MPLTAIVFLVNMCCSNAPSPSVSGRDSGADASDALSDRSAGDSRSESRLDDVQDTAIDAADARDLAQDAQHPIEVGPCHAPTRITESHFISTSPFLGSTVSMSDAEGMTYVPSDDTLWLADDDGSLLYEVDRATGELRSTVGRELGNAVQHGGGGTAGGVRMADLEAVAWHPSGQHLLAFSGRCCPSTPAVFRLARNDGAPPFAVDTFQPLRAPHDDLTGAAYHPNGELYVSQAREIKRYDYESNEVLDSFSIPGVEGTIFGLGFVPAGSLLWLVTSEDNLVLVDWARREVVSDAVFDLTAFGILDARAVDGANGQVYVLDGMDGSGPRTHAVVVFDVHCTP